MQEKDFLRFLEQCKANGIDTIGQLKEAQKEEYGTLAYFENKLAIAKMSYELMEFTIKDRLKSGCMDLNDMLLYSACQRNARNNILYAQKELEWRRRDENNK